MVVGCVFRPMAAQAAALLAIQAALDPAVPIAPEENRLYMQHAVFYPGAELLFPLSQRHSAAKAKTPTLK